MTKTRTYRAFTEVAFQFIDDYQLPEPSSVHIYVNAGSISLLIDGEGATANLISEALYWETNEVGITVAHVVYDGVHVTVQVFEP